MLGFLPATGAEVEPEFIEGVGDIHLLQYGLISLDALPLEKIISHTSSMSSPKERITALKEAMRYMFSPLRNCFKTELEV